MTLPSPSSPRPPAAAPSPGALAARWAAHGFWRRSPWPRGGRAGHREWLHFVVHGDSATVVINASIADDLRPAAGPGRERAALLVLVHTAAGWDGDLDESSEPDAPGGQLRARVADAEVVLAGDRVRLRGRLRARPIAFDLELVPRAFPSLASGVAIGGAPPLHWLVVPRLAASGAVTVGDEAHTFVEAPAYHDHNWGYFSHGDVAWQWGHACGAEAAGAHSVVLARLLDRAQLSTFMRALLLWRGARQLRVFRGAEVEVHGEGLLRPARPLVVPRAAALLIGEGATEVPRRLHIAARGGGDWIEAVFDAASVARVVVPHDRDLTATVVHEVGGRLGLRGQVRGEPVELVAPAMFELLGRVE